MSQTGPTLDDIGLELRTGASDLVALAEAALASATSGDPALFTVPMPERARAEARHAGDRHRAGRRLGPLDGVPTVWKDLFDIEGHPTTAGSRVLSAAPPATRDAAVVEALTAAGMVTLGRVNMSEFAYSGLGLNPHYGTPVNPLSPAGDARVPGGSSSGSAVAVASGLVPVAVGSDTGGSVRIPAAFNGIVGYKSSAGRYDMGGVFPLSRTLDTLGVFAHSAADAAIVDAAMRRLVAPSARRADIRLLTLIVPDNVVFERVQPAVAANFSAALDRLTEAGARIERRTIAAFDAILALFERCGPLAGAEAYHLHRGRVEDPAAAAAMDRRVVDRVLLGRRTSAPDYQDLLIARQQLRAEAAELFDVGRCVAFPTVAHVAPAIAPLEADRDLFVAVNALTLRNTMLGNFLDWCGVSLPSGTDTAGLPTGFLINGGPGQDDDLLGTALAIEDLVRGPGRPDTF